MIAAPVASLDAHSSQARAISDLFGETLVICTIIGVVVAGLVGYCALKFRARAGGPAPAQTHGNTSLEIAWTLLPLAVVVGLFVRTAQAMGTSDPPPNREPDIVVVGHQWWWEARYASGAVTANEIQIPAGKDLLVRVESADVIHDFWVPQLGRKVDAIPGHATHVWIRADDPGTYLGACAEYCGTQHAWMRIRVVARSQAEFDAWDLATSKPLAGLASDAPEVVRGEQVFHARTCPNCHAISTTTSLALPRAAPDLTHFEQRATIGAGVLDNTHDNLVRWLTSPQDVKPGSHMPDLNLTDAEVADLAAYLETLR